MLRRADEALPANGPEGASWCRQGCGKVAIIHTEGHDHFPGAFFMTLFLFIGRQKGAVQEMEEIAGVVDTH